ncbi:MAG: Dabb family protein [Eubacteriales bacterium]|nr:Dabb family protein [Eubacteriales bacterium]
MKHCIIVKYNETVDAEKKKALLPEIQEVFAPLLKMDGIHAIDLIPNVIDRPNRYDLMIRIDMEEEALPAYDASQPHKNWKANYAHYLEKKAIFDYE